MLNKLFFAGFLSGLFSCASLFSQPLEPALLHHPWKAGWITVPGESPTGYGIYLFRRTLKLSDKPAALIIHVSADNRYKLYVNDSLVSLGPARGDLTHWYYETLDIAGFLHPGMNTVSAEVWNEGEWRAEGQISLRSGFLLEADGVAGDSLNTVREWKCIRDSSFKPLPFHTRTYYVAGPGEIVDYRNNVGRWRTPEFNDSSWKNAQFIMEATPHNVSGGYGTIGGWELIPRSIPPMELTSQRMSRLVRSGGVHPAENFPSQKAALNLEPHKNVTLLLDQGFLTNAYPEVRFSGGRGSRITLTYAEALYTRYPFKGNRNETDGKTILGRQDSIISGGSIGQIFIPHSYRTYRYLQIDIQTADEPLVLDDISAHKTGYPFQYNAVFHSDDTLMARILETGWRTAENCAMETYMDCPYYEQLQYIGDTRIQALISFYNSGDERLLRKAMDQMDESRRPEGISMSRHPSYTPQIIPPFSLWYIGMLHDYMMYGRDSGYVRNKLAGERQILDYFHHYQRKDGRLAGVPYWNFTDWVDKKDWNSGVGPTGKDGTSSLLDLQLLWAYQLAAAIEKQYGSEAYARLYLGYAAQLKQSIRSAYWDENRKLLADRAEKDLFSQHANTLGILTGIFSAGESNLVAGKLLTDTTLAPASIYFKYYLHRALIQTGLGNDYLQWLGKWKENLDMGLSTWAEMSDIANARSDCHAWGASPNIELFRTVLGIDSEAPGFSRVRIEPHPGHLNRVNGEIPHPLGKINLSCEKKQGHWSVTVRSPVPGTFIWKGKSYGIRAGVNEFSL